MSILGSITALIVPLLALFVPGIGLVGIHGTRGILGYATRVFLWSLSISILVSYVGITLGLPIIGASILLAVVAVAGVWQRRAFFFSLPTLWYVLAALVPIVLLYGLFGVLFLTYHDGLPTGDSQKAIIWARMIQETGSLPDYGISNSLLNRDPVDFYTPGLHALIAVLMSLSPLPLITVGFFAIALAITAAIIGAAIGKELFDTRSRIFPAVVVGLLVLTNIRFLRYVREPGYHLQNILGEVLLFGLIFLGISLIRRWRIQDGVLFVLALLALAFSHQFSTFIAVFLLAPYAIVFVLSKREAFMRSLARHVSLGFIGLAGAGILLVGGILLGLHKKIPHIFTTEPHLLSQIPLFTSYFTLMGPVWLMLGITGLALLIVHAYKKHEGYREAWAFIASTIILLALSQGPRLFIDIPPVRALFYTVIPFSICGAYAIAKLLEYIREQSVFPNKKLLSAAVVGMILVVFATSFSTAFTTLSHNVRTNSTLTAELGYAIEASAQQDGAVLIDDYNRRSSSWLVLNGRPLFARIAADLERQMEEAFQSDERYDLYLKQLDFEKIFSLGSFPEITQLMRKHRISDVVGVDGASATSIMHNPSLHEVLRADDLTMFATSNQDVPPALLADPGHADITQWLLRPATLANDIGDDEDVFAHLPASIRATRLSEAVYDGAQTYRVSTAPAIPLSFNVKNYVRVLWDKEHTGKPDTSVELFVRLAYPVTGLSVQTESGKIFPLQSQLEIIPIKADDVMFNEQGFIVLTLLNPAQKDVAIDAIALGLARVP